MRLRFSFDRRRSERASISRWNAWCWGGGREAEGGGLLNRYTGKTRIEGSNPSLPVREPAERRALVLTAIAATARHVTGTTSLCAVTDGLSPCRRGENRSLQLALRPPLRRRIPAAHRGHRQGAPHGGEHQRDIR